MSHKLFYSPSDKKLFYIAGYRQEGTTSDVIKTMKEGEDVINSYFKTKRKDRQIHTLEVMHSRRYKSMRVFYVTTNVIPKEAFSLSGNGWTMWKWLEN